MQRRTLLYALAASTLPRLLTAKEHLPQNLTFLGEKKFQQIIALAERENWRSLPIGERITRAALAMNGIPYMPFTLEIHDHIESPSVNFNGLDCWTFFEIALGIARLLVHKQAPYTTSDLLQQIEITRYRGGVCRGNYLDRIHYLDEWFRDNQKRGHLKDITSTLGDTVLLKGRKIDEMTVLWKSYRYLKNNPELRPKMAQIEAELESHPFHYLPKSQVSRIEPKLQNGDIIGIVTHKPHVYCSHVGLIVRPADGQCHFMHASQTYKKVLVDKTLSEYLADFKSHAGIVVARPRD